VGRDMTDRKNPTKLSKHIRDSPLTYDKIAYEIKICGRDTISRAVNRPSRTSLETYLKLAAAVNMNLEEAEQEWRESKFEHLKMKAGI